MMKKISALMLALVMVLAMGTAAFAADEPTTAADVYTGDSQTTVDGNNIPLTKGIVLFNTDGKEIREPNISFTYTVTPVSTTVAEGALLGTENDPVTVTDKTPVTLAVYNGVSAAFANTLTIDFADTNDKAAAAIEGTELERTGNLVVDPSKFPHAGIYRFVITEAPDPEDVTDRGLDERATGTDGYITTRYLDVYIKNDKDDQGKDTLVLYGAVIFKTVKTTNNGTDDITTSFEKTTGFEPKGGEGSSYEEDKTVDKYHTFNLEVNKTISGGLADKTHDFPFEITLTGDKAATIITDYSKSGASYVGTEPTTVNINSTTPAVLTPALSDGDSVTITGIPVGTTVQVKETNDTYDEYTPSIKTQTGFTGLTLDPNAALKKDDFTQLSEAAEITDKTQNSVIGLENTLAEISPTGVVMRVAPYALILAAGMALLLISRRRKAVVEE